METSRILAEGPWTLCDAELLAAVAGSESLRPMLDNGIARLRGVTGGELRLHGASEREAARILAALELGRRVTVAPPAQRPRLLRARDLAQTVWPRLSHLPHEEFWALLLNARLQEIRWLRISLGGLAQCSVTPREAFGAAVLLRASAVAFAHNHPSGDATPSASDQRMQLALDEAGHALGVRVVDHLVVGEHAVHSAVEGQLSIFERGGDS